MQRGQLLTGQGAKREIVVNKKITPGSSTVFSKLENVCVSSTSLYFNTQLEETGARKQPQPGHSLQQAAELGWGQGPRRVLPGAPERDNVS